jgi:hypothetical protein
MTEAQWLACRDPEAMLKFLRRKASDRKRRLFACACCRRVWDLIPDERSRSAVGLAEQFADGLTDRAALDAARVVARDAYQQFSTAKGPPYDGHYATGACVCVVAGKAGDAVKAWYGAASATQMRRMADSREQTPAFTSHPVMQASWETERAAQSASLRDIFGNPFRPVAVDPNWLTSTVVALAKGIYEERAFDRLPILADALQDAGCDHEDILDHCRGPGPHARGCWVVDLVLGKA